MNVLNKVTFKRGTEEIETFWGTIIGNEESSRCKGPGGECPWDEAGLEWMKGKWLDEVIGRVRGEMGEHLVAHEFYVEWHEKLVEAFGHRNVTLATVFRINGRGVKLDGEEHDVLGERFMPLLPLEKGTHCPAVKSVIRWQPPTVSFIKVLPQFLNEITLFFWGAEGSGPRQSLNKMVVKGPIHFTQCGTDHLHGQPLLQSPLLCWQRLYQVGITIQQQPLRNPAFFLFLSQVLLPSVCFLENPTYNRWKTRRWMKRLL